MAQSVMKTPNLIKKPNLSTAFSRKDWIQAAFERNHSESARLARENITRRLDHYTQKIHGMKPEEVFEWIKSESETPEILAQFAIDFLTQYVKFCRMDHKDIEIKRGAKQKNEKKQIYTKKGSYLHKLHDNSIGGIISRTRGFMSQVGGIRLHDDDMKRVPLPTVLIKGNYDDEEAEPLNATQARNVINRTRSHKSIILYNFMNDTGFRISEAGMVIDSDFDLEITVKHPLATVKCPAISVKGTKAKGTRFMRDSTANLIRTLIGKNKFVFRHSDTQSNVSFRLTELKKIKHVYDSLGMNQVFEDTGRRKFNNHSWRKRCGTEYARANTEELAHGYLRHAGNLKQYMIKTPEERIEAFQKAEIDLAIDEISKEKARNKALKRELSENEMLRERLDQLEKDLSNQAITKKKI